MSKQMELLRQNMDPACRRIQVTALIISVLTSGLLLVNPALSQRLIDEVIVPQNAEPLLGILGIMLAVKLGREGLRYLMVMLLETSSQNMVFNLRRSLFEKLQYSDIRFYDLHRTGDLMTRMSGDLDWCRHFVSYIDYRITDSVCTFVFAVAYLLTVNWKLTMLLIVITPALLLITKFFSKTVRPRFVFMRDKLSEMNAAAQENIAGNRVVKAFAREEYEEARFEEKDRAYMDSNLEINRTWLTFFPIIELLVNAIQIVTVFVGGLFIINGEMSPGQLAVFTGLSWTVSNPMRELGNLINDLQRFSTSAAKVMELYYRTAEITDSQDAIPHARVEGGIEFRHVSFRIDSHQILQDISFSVKPGQTVAVLGPTGGSGKTTLINLLSRFYNLSGGRILLRDLEGKSHDISRATLHSLRSQMGIMMQDSFLFAGTLMDNIRYGRLEAIDREVREAARRVRADDFISRLPMGYKTEIRERKQSEPGRKAAGGLCPDAAFRSGDPGAGRSNLLH